MDPNLEANDPNLEATIPDSQARDPSNEPPDPERQGPRPDSEPTQPSSEAEIRDFLTSPRIEPTHGRAQRSCAGAATQLECRTTTFPAFVTTCFHPESEPLASAAILLKLH